MFNKNIPARSYTDNQLHPGQQSLDPVKSESCRWNMDGYESYCNHGIQCMIRI